MSPQVCGFTCDITGLLISICIYNYSEVKFPQHVVCEPCGGNVLGGYDPKSKQVLYLKGLKCQRMFSLFNCLFSDCPL